MKWNDRHKTMLANFLGRRERGSFLMETQEQSTNFFSPASYSAPPGAGVLSPKIENKPQSRFRQRDFTPLKLNTLLKDSPGIPAYNAILGVCEDTLPVLFDLKDHSIRSVLAVSDSHQTTFDVLTSLVFSSAALNPSRHLQVLVISSRAESWREHPAMRWAGRSCLGIHSVYNREAEFAILQTAEWARDTQLGQRRGAQLLLLLDDLAACAEMDLDARLNLEWILREGSPLGIKPIAVVAGSALLDIAAWIRNFSMVLLGEIQDRRTYYTLNLLDADEEFPVLDQVSLAAKIENGWFIFRTLDAS